MIHINNKIKAGIIDDSVELCNCISKHLKKKGVFEVLGIAHDGEEGLEMLKTKRVDVCILDLVLPKKDGLYVLEQLKRKEASETLFIILSSVNNPAIMEKAREFGADYYMLKPFDYNLLSNRIIEIYNFKNKTDLKILEDVFENSEITGNFSSNFDGVDEYIVKMLNTLGIASNLKGYKYLKTALNLTIMDENNLNSLTKVLYPEIAKIHNTTNFNVERSIRHAIFNSIEKNNHQLYTSLFDSYSTKSKLTNGKFVFLITEQYNISKKHRKDII